MDEWERRLTAALHAEADALQPRRTSWDGQAGAVARRGWPAWVAVAAVVAALVVAITVGATSGGGPPDAARPPADATSTTPSGWTDPTGALACDGGWTSFGAPVITGAGQSMPAGTSAILRFAGGPPGRATLCAVVSGADNTTLASGSAVPDASGMPYLATISGVDSFVIGAISAETTSVTFTRPGPGTSSAAVWTATVTAATPGVTDLGSGWHGYTLLAPTGAYDLTVEVVQADGTRNSRHITVIGRAAAAPSSAVRPPPVTTPRTTPTQTSAGTTSASIDSAAAAPVRCGGQLAAPLPGVSATVIPEPAGRWQFRLVNATKLPLTIDTTHGYAQVMSDGNGVIDSISLDSSYVLGPRVTLRAGDSTALRVVGMDALLCTGGRLAVGDHTVHLVLSGQLAGRVVTFTAATLTVRFPRSGLPTLVE